MITIRAGCMALSLVATPAQAAWFEARSNYFVVYAQGNAEAARDQAIELERFDKGMRILRSTPEDPTSKANPLTIFVVQDVTAVRRLCEQIGRTKANCANTAGFYEGHASGSVAFMPRRSGAGGTYDLSAQTVLFHEYAHHMMFRYATAAYPAWFVEGFAEFNAATTIDKDGNMSLGRPALHRAYGLILGDKLPIRKLLTARGPELNAEDREQLYGRGWLLCHYLVFAPARTGQLDVYLGKVAEGTASLKAAEETFGDLTKLDRELDHYLQTRKWHMVTVGAQETTPTDIKVRQLAPGEAAIMPVRIRSRRGVDTASAQDVVRAARTIAAGYPADPMVQDALAEAEFDAGNDDQAIAAADRALAADEHDRRAMLYEGRARMRQASRRKQTDPKIWSEVRRWFMKANRAEPDAAEPLMLFYLSYLAQGIKPTANAVMGLEQAQAIAPEDDELRLIMGMQLLRDGRKLEARVTLVPLAFGPHAAADNPAALIVAAIDKGDAAGIASLLAGPPVN